MIIRNILFIFLCCLSIMGCKQKPPMQQVLNGGGADAEIMSIANGIKLEKDSGLVYCYVDSQRMAFNDDYMDSGALAMMAHPTDRYVYVVGDIVPNSNGWTVRYHLYRVDRQTLETKHIGNFAAIHFEDNGFRAAVTRLTNPDATCTADEVFAIHDVYFNEKGLQIRESKKEYRYDEMQRLYSDSLVNAIGL